MNTQPHEIEELERRMLEIMVALVVRDPNGMLKIQQAVHDLWIEGADLGRFEPVMEEVRVH